MKKIIASFLLILFGICGIYAQDSIPQPVVSEKTAIEQANPPKEDMSVKEIVELITSIIAIGGLIATPLLTVRSHFGYKNRNMQQDEAKDAFNRVVAELASRDTKRNLAAAIKIRRFFTEEINAHSARLREEAIKVISSLLRTLQTGVYQKTLADGLAYAQDLSLVDLQRTNLQNTYFGLKKEEEKAKVIRTKFGILWQRFCQVLMNMWNAIVRLVEVPVDSSSEEPVDEKINAKTYHKIRIHQTDFYLADLSYALFEYVDGDAYFTSAILCHTRFKLCDLRGANFKGADLSNVFFKQVKLKGADFSNAINLPKDLKDKLDDAGKFTQDEVYTTPAVAQEPKQIFFSVPSILDPQETYYKESLSQYLNTRGYIVIPYVRDQYPQFGQIKSVAERVKMASGMVVFGFKQTQVVEGFYRPHTSETQHWTNKWLPSPWNEIEVGMASMKNIPVLIVKEDGINTGIFDIALSETDIITYTVPEKTMPIEWEGCNELQQFLSKL